MTLSSATSADGVIVTLSESEFCHEQKKRVIGGGVWNEPIGNGETSERYMPADGRPRASLEGGGSPSRWEVYKSRWRTPPSGIRDREEVDSDKQGGSEVVGHTG